MLFPIKDDNPTHRPSIVTIMLIVINVLVFAYEMTLGPSLEAFISAFGTIPYEITRGVDLVGNVPGSPFPHHAGPPVIFFTLFTSMFMHGGFMHLGGNMLYLWIFGNNVECRLGHVKFLLFYLLCGLVAAAGQIIPDPASKVPMLGASGAVAGVLGAYLIMYPRARVLTVVIIRLVWLPAMIVLGIWFALQFFQGVASLGAGGAGGGVAWFAHVGGFVAGVVVALAAGGRVGVRRRPREV
jgi:membrane associated rhomboid family serine protease